MWKGSYEGEKLAKGQIIAKYLITCHNPNIIQVKAATATEPSCFFGFLRCMKFTTPSQQECDPQVHALAV